MNDAPFVEVEIRLISIEETRSNPTIESNGNQDPGREKLSEMHDERARSAQFGIGDMTVEGNLVAKAVDVKEPVG